MMMWRILLVTFVLVVGSAPAMAVSTQDETISSCGIKEDDIIPGDGTICKEDIAFGMLYELFPSIMESINPLLDMTPLSQVSEGTPSIESLRGEYYGDKVFFVLFDLFYDLILVCIAIYIGLIGFNAGLRMLKGESLSEESPTRDSTRSWVVGAGIGGAFLLPYKQFFLGQVIVFSLGVASLSMANFVLSLFLSSQEAMFEQSTQGVSQVFAENGVNEIKRHDYLSDSYYRYLVRMELCRRETAAYWLTAMAQDTESPEDLKSWYQCAYGNDGAYGDSTGVIKSQEVPFVWLAFEESSTPLAEDYINRTVSNVSFLIASAAAPQCDVIKDAPQVNYSCGSIDIHQPNWSNNAFIQLMGKRVFLSAIARLTKGLKPGMSGPAITGFLESEWGTFYRAVEDANHTLNESMEDFLSLTNRADATDEQLASYRQYEKIKLDKSQKLIKQLSIYFHQEAMNILTFGNVWHRRNKVDDEWNDWAKLSTHSSMDGLTHHLSKAREIADAVERIQCLELGNSLGRPKKALAFLQGETVQMSEGAQFRCLDMDAGVVIEHDALHDSGGEGLRQYAVARMDVLADELKVLWQRTVIEHSAQRKGIETAYLSSVESIEGGNWWLKMRQEGYLSVASYAFKMNDAIQSLKIGVRQIVNHYSLKSPAYDARYVSNDLANDEVFESDFPLYMYGDQALHDTRPKGRTIDPFVDNNHWIMGQVQQLRQPSLNHGGLEDWGSILQFFKMPSVMGLGVNGEKDEEACLTEASRCPFPLRDPLVELNQFGHDLVNVAISFYSLMVTKELLDIGIDATRVTYKTSSGLRKGLGDRLAITESSKTGKGLKVTKGAFKILGSLGGAMLGQADVLFEMLSGIMLFVLGIGALLAYALPLLPYMYLYMGFITWITVLVMSSFSILLWTLFWIRYKEKQDLLKKAGYHYGLELLFKPTFNLLSVLFAWYFFYGVAFVINMMSHWVFDVQIGGMSDGGFFRSYIDPMFTWLMVCFVYMVGLRYAYKLMDTLTMELLQKLGVDKSKDNDKMSALMKTVLFDMAKGKTDQMKGAMDNAKDKKMSDMQNKLNDAYQNTRDITNATKRG
jgi:hypothetical protein